MIETIEQIIEAAGKSKSSKYYFSEDTLRFFRSKVYDDVYPGRDGTFFVTSEKNPPHARRYTIRLCKPDGEISTVGKFQEYETLAVARYHANLYALRIKDCAKHKGGEV